MEFNAEQMDALQELANIGAAHAATTLSQMIGSLVSMTVPEINLVDIADVGDYFGDESTTLVIFELQGDIAHGGYLILHYPEDSAMRTANILLGTLSTDSSMGEMDQSAVLEVSNIMISAFLSAGSDFIGIIMLPSPPVLIHDMPHAVIESLLAQMNVEVNDVILFKMSLFSDEHHIKGNILLFLEVTTLIRLSDLLQAMMHPDLK
jgi:chemotaxis protein CheC